MGGWTNRSGSCLRHTDCRCAGAAFATEGLERGQHCKDPRVRTEPLDARGGTQEGLLGMLEQGPLCSLLLLVATSPKLSLCKFRVLPRKVIVDFSKMAEVSLGCSHSFFLVLQEGLGLHNCHSLQLTLCLGSFKAPLAPIDAFLVDLEGSLGTKRPCGP